MFSKILWVLIFWLKSTQGNIFCFRYVCLSVCQSVCQPIYLSCLSDELLYVSLYLFLAVCLSVCLCVGEFSVGFYVCPYECLCILLHLNISVCLAAYMSVCAIDCILIWLLITPLSQPVIKIFFQNSQDEGFILKFYIFENKFPDSMQSRPKENRLQPFV